MKNKMKVLIIAVLCLMALVGIASAALVSPNPVPKDSSNVCPGYAIGFKLEKDSELLVVNPEFLTDGTYCDDEGNCVYIDFYCSDGSGRINAFNFKDATFYVQLVVVKAGTTQNEYRYADNGFLEVTADTALLSPEGKDISHINFCGIATPEFPTLALPVGMMIGIVGLVYVVRNREE